MLVIQEIFARDGDDARQQTDEIFAQLRAKYGADVTFKSNVVYIDGAFIPSDMRVSGPVLSVTTVTRADLDACRNVPDGADTMVDEIRRVARKQGMTVAVQTKCAWCGNVLSEGTLPASHGICASCQAIQFPPVHSPDMS